MKLQGIETLSEVAPVCLVAIGAVSSSLMGKEQLAVCSILDILWVPCIRLQSSDVVLLRASNTLIQHV